MSGRLIGIAVVAVLVSGCADRAQDLFQALMQTNHRALEAALKRGRDPNERNAKGLTPLHVAISARDTSAVRLLLQYGARPGVADAGGETALRAALLAALGRDSVDAEQRMTAGPRDPGMMVMRLLTSAVRESSAVRTDVTGTLNVAMAYQGIGPNGRLRFVSRIELATADQTYDLALSRKETDYFHVGMSGDSVNWNLVLRPGKRYRVIGDRKDGQIEAVLLALAETPADSQAIVVPTQNYLPSTWQRMLAETWLGKH